METQKEVLFDVRGQCALITLNRPDQRNAIDRPMCTQLWGAFEDFEKDLKSNLYKIWNRMSSGSYFPPPVKAVLLLPPLASAMPVPPFALISMTVSLKTSPP